MSTQSAARGVMESIYHMSEGRVPGSRHKHQRTWPYTLMGWLSTVGVLLTLTAAAAR